MLWIALALLAPLFFAGSNILDKYALDKISRGNYDFLFFGTVGTFVMGFLALAAFGLEEVSWFVLIPIAGGFCLQYSYLFYSYALNYEDASYVVPLYITQSVFTLLLGSLFFKEGINGTQFIAFIVVFLGALVLSLEKLSFKIFHYKKYRKGALLMVPAMIFYALYTLLANESLERISFSDTFIYDALGMCLGVGMFFLVPAWRTEIFQGIKRATVRKYNFFLFNDTLDMTGQLIYKMALLMAPSASLVAVLEGIQPFYVLIIGLFFTLYFPKIIRENIELDEVVQKVLGVMIIVAGITILSLSS